MQVLNISESSIDELTNLPETGMGFQLVEASVWGEIKPLLVFNSSRVIDLSEIRLASGDDPFVILRNGLQIIDLLKGSERVVTLAPAPHSFRLLESRIGGMQAPSLRGVLAVRAAIPSSLVKHVTLTTKRVFHRFSAFYPDRRIHPVTGNVLPGSYAAPSSEVPFVPIGFVAVGRFALPNNLPASFRFEIEPPVGTSVDFGTVAPAFGQAGGGVEAFFVSGVKNVGGPPKPPSRLPDE